MDRKLTQLKADFAKWRASRKSIRARTPETLKNRAILLGESMRVGALCSELEISHSAFLKWRKTASTPSKTEFASLAVPAELVPEGSLKIQLERPDGVKLTISGASDSIIAGFVAKFISRGTI